MKNIILVAFVITNLFFLSCTNDQVSNNVVVTPHPLATETGQSIFELGGNAFDVAVASGFHSTMEHYQIPILSRSNRHFVFL